MSRQVIIAEKVLGINNSRIAITYQIKILVPKKIIGNQTTSGI